MAIIINDRDKALQAAPYRSKQAAVTITGTASAFLASKNTVTILPTTITLTATPSGSVYTNQAVYTWSYALSTSPATWVPLGFGTNQTTQVLNNTDSWVTDAFVQYRCVVTEPLLDTSVAYYTITFTREASDPVIVNLLRSNVLVTCDSAGTPTTQGLLASNQTITVTRGNTQLDYNTNTTTPNSNSFSVSYVPVNLTVAAGTGSGKTWTQPAITAIALDGATITYTVTVYDSATPPAPSTFVRTVVYNKVNNGVIGANGAPGENLNPVVNYDFAGATLPSGVTYLGSRSTYESNTATLIQNSATDQQVRLTNLDLIPANSYIISMRVKFISGTWEGTIFYTSATRAIESQSYIKTIPQPALDVWTTINVDMRQLTQGTTDYISGGNITQLRFDFAQDTATQVAIDYISVGKFGVAEATKTITVSMYQWSNSGVPAYTGAFTYTWSTGAISAFPANWTSSAPTAPGSGYTLYQRSLVLSDVRTATTTSSNWNLSTQNTIGFRQDGTIGVQGDSYRIAYAVTPFQWTNPTAPASNNILAPLAAIIVTATAANTNIATITTPIPLQPGTLIILYAGTSFGGLAAQTYYIKTVVTATTYTLSTSSTLETTVPLSTSTGTLSGTARAWSFVATSTLTDGQYMYQSDGILNSSTNTITWGMPYLSNLKVGNLSALSASLGTVEVASGGALRSGKTNFDTAASGFFLGNDSGTPKFRVGNADNSAGLSWNGTQLDVKGNISAGQFTTGSITGYAWPAAGLYGTYLGPSGLLLGNGTSGGKYFQVTADGNIYAPGFTVANGNAVFSGALSGATGEFAGTLRAGVLDLTTFSGISYTYGTPGAYYLSVPSGRTSMRVTIVGAGGGGGGGSSRAGLASGAGGGGGGLVLQTFTGLAVGTQIAVYVGAGGTAGSARDGFFSSGSSGGSGGNTNVYYGSTLYASAGGGGGGQVAGDTYPAGGAGGGFGATAGERGNYEPYGNVANGANGGSSRYGAGGFGGGADGGQAATVPGPGGGGGGGGTNNAFNSISYQGAAGGSGYAIIEFFDPNTVVLRTDYTVLLSALARQGIATT